MRELELERIESELETYELALKGWEYLTVDQERDAIKNIIRLRKEKEKLIIEHNMQSY